MANKVVNLTISLKDSVSGKLGGIKSRLSSLGDGFKKVAIAGVAMAGAIGAALVQMAKTFAAQQDAEVALASALKNVGLEGEKLLPIFQEYATSIQRVTKYGDEAILASMAYGKNLGINTGQLREATTAAIGLASKYKIDLQTAMMLVGRASQGQTQMLTRYGIVLEETLSPQEKFNKVLEIGAEAFQLAKDETQSLSGAWTQFKNAVGDAQETIISAMADGDGMVETLNKMTEAIAKLIDEGDISFWASDVRDALKGIKDFLDPLIKAFSFLGQAVAAGTRTAGAYIGGAAGEWSAQSTGEKFSYSGQIDRMRAGFSAAGSAQQDYLDRREAFKKAFKEEATERKKLAEETAALGGEIQTEKAKEAGDALVEKAKEVSAEIKTGVDEAGASFGDKIAEAIKDAEPTTPPATPEPQTRSGPETGGFASIAQRLLESGEVRRGKLDETMESIAEFEKKGREAGFTGLGESAADFFSKGESSRTVEKMIQGILDAQIKGEEILGGDIDDPLATTNKILLDIYKVTGGMKTEEGA